MINEWAWSTTTVAVPLATVVTGGTSFSPLSVACNSTGVEVSVGVLVAVAVAVPVAVATGVAVVVGLGVAVTVGVAVGVFGGGTVDVGVAVGVLGGGTVDVDVDVGVGAGGFVGVRVDVGGMGMVLVRVLVGVAVLIGAGELLSSPHAARKSKSTLLSAASVLVVCDPFSVDMGYSLFPWRRNRPDEPRASSSRSAVTSHQW